MHINYAQSEDLLESLITDVLEQNDGLCMDNEKERMALAQALVFHLTGKAVDLHATGRCISWRGRYDARVAMVLRAIGMANS